MGRVSALRLSLSVALVLVLLAAFMPATAMAAPQGKPLEYIVALQVADSGRNIAPSGKAGKTRLRQRAVRAHEATDRVTRAHGVKARHRYGNALTGFSAKMTAAEAAAVASDPSVVSVRLARTFRTASETIPFGIKRVKAWTTGTTPGPDVNAHVAVLDTGIGESRRSTSNVWTGQPVSANPAGNELNIRGGINCFDNPQTGVNEATAHPGYWADVLGHGTHVAGIIGARDNSKGVIGVAPGVNLWSVRVFGGQFGNQGSEAAVICGLDWAIATHSNATPDIDVINMSMQGPRLDYRETCSTILSLPQADPIHKGICTATAMGISVVASAGNDGINANDSSPGGFNQVISVGALNDFDGTGWGKGPKGPCGGFRSEVDDDFASYSNHGSEVDIVAPGTCVESLAPLMDGTAKATLTGTSMAAPHVTGAVARYLAAHPNTSASTMRNLVRASGRMDWDAKTDPVWSGVNDDDAPNRVLDVKALTGGDLLRVWAYHDRFKVGGTVKSRTTRVDVQRGGGYASTVNLSLNGLPAAVGSKSFGKGSLSGLGRNDLGTNLTLNLKTNGPDGQWGLGINANGAGVAAADPRGLDLTVDRTGPEVSGLQSRLRGNSVSMTAKGAAQTYLQWSVSDVTSSVESAKLQRKTNGSAWRTAGTGGTTSSRVTLKPGQINKFRVKATDSLGNSRLGEVVLARLSVRDSKSSQWQKPAGQWKTKKVQKAFGGSILLANGSTDALRTSFSGAAAAVVGSKGPGRGSFEVRIDGGEWLAVSLKSSKSGHRKVVWSRVLEDGQHTLEIRGKSGQTAVDALLIVR